MLDCPPMPKISIDHNSSLQASESYEKIKEFFENDQDLRKLDPKMKATYDDKTRTGKVTGSQFKADLSVDENGPGSVVKLRVDLPLLLTPFKGKVEETLQKKLKKYLA